MSETTMDADKRNAWLRKLDKVFPHQVMPPRRQLSDDIKIMDFLTSYVGKFDMYVEDDYAAFVRYCFEEARYISKSFEDVWNSYECENDRRDAVQDCMIGGTTEVDDIDTVIKEAEAAAENLIKRPEVWRAIVALADSLPAVGKFQGKQAAAIIKSAMKD